MKLLPRVDNDRFIFLLSLNEGPEFVLIPKNNLSQKTICKPITFNNPLRVCFSNKKNTITTRTRPT